MRGDDLAYHLKVEYEFLGLLLQFLALCSNKASQQLTTGPLRRSTVNNCTRLAHEGNEGTLLGRT